MPIYEYRCRQCGSVFEKLVRFSTQPSEIECPKCQAHQAERQLSLVAATGSGKGSCGPGGGGRFS